MSDSAQLGVADVDLRLAVGRPGCPICRLQRRTEQRYIKGILGETLNDQTTRMHLVRSLGLCPEHNRQLFRTEIASCGDSLAASIVYEDLARRLAQALNQLGAEDGTTFPGRRWWGRAWARLRRMAGGAAPTPSLLADLYPQEPCRVCEQGRRAAVMNLRLLVQGCADPAFRDRYAASDLLCLPHLRLALPIAAEAGGGVVGFLAEAAGSRLHTLAGELGEYIRKHAWQYRLEPLSDGEAAAPLRAAHFLAGLQPGEEL
ncbi:MAG: DUF6062 family protein [Anaerolineae bacterium]